MIERLTSYPFVIRSGMFPTNVTHLFHKVSCMRSRYFVGKVRDREIPKVRSGKVRLVLVWHESGIRWPEMDRKVWRMGA